MLVLGESADDKGAQLEALVGTLLAGQGYQRIRLNMVGAGGNELDVFAERESPIMGKVQVTPLFCEAKAYAHPVNMPVWQRYLGKLFIERVRDSNTIGLLIALNGVNGNVAGSLANLEERDSALFVFDGSVVLRLAGELGQVSPEEAVRETLLEQFPRNLFGLESAYYRGAFYWIARWSNDKYSVVDGHGKLLPTEQIETLRPAVTDSVSGALLATDEVRAEAEALHIMRLAVMNRLFRGDAVPIDSNADNALAVAGLAAERFTAVVDGELRLLPASELDAGATSRLFLSLFEAPIRVSLLSFMIEGHHVPYVERLVELLPDLQGGFTPEVDDAASLRALAPLFPSVWPTLASEIPMITTHRRNQTETPSEDVLATDRGTLWEAVAEAIRLDFSNSRLHGFLYDYLGVAELQVSTEMLVKGKHGAVGKPIRTTLRNAVRQFDHEAIDAEGPIYVQVRMLPGVAEPWEEAHPDPAFPLE